MRSSSRLALPARPHRMSESRRCPESHAGQIEGSLHSIRLELESRQGLDRIDQGRTQFCELVSDRRDRCEHLLGMGLHLWIY